MKKYIHYCWFGTKPFPKLGKKCLASWKKYLPDFEIIKWSEENVDLNECPFIKEAYENGKWAFVSDYVRTKVLKEYGGIYFDTDMEVLKYIDELLKNDTFLGIEDTGFVAVGVWYEKEKNGLLPTKVLEEYQKMPSLDLNNLSNLSIPKIVSKILSEYGFIHGKNEIQILNDNIYIYPREYFYPYSYNRENNIFTDNTCMIHYYDASWVPKKERIENALVRKLGRKKTFKILKIYRLLKFYIRKLAKIMLFPITIYKRKKRKDAQITSEYLNDIENTIRLVEKNSKKDYIVIHNGNYLGVTSATLELFDNTVDAREILRKQDVKKIGDKILNSNIKQVIFSSFPIGYKNLAKYLKKKNNKIKLKSYWHGSHSQILDSYGFERNIEIIKLHKKGIIDVMGICKKSLVEFYKKENYNVAFLTNKVETNIKPINKNNDKIRIGLYAAQCSDWRKNMFSQIAAASLIENAILDMAPLNEEGKEFAKTLGLELEGVDHSLKREELIKRMGNNTVNLYVTLSECSPMLPLESFEMNVPCITGNNHHYFKNSELEKYLVVNNEEDVTEIKDKIIKCIENQEKILELYKTFKKELLKESKKDVEEFLNM